MTQISTDAYGSAEVERMFRRLFTVLPDLVAIPQRSVVNDNVVFIESDCTTTLGNRAVHFSVCDRFVIDHGKLLERR